MPAPATPPGSLPTTAPAASTTAKRGQTFLAALAIVLAGLAAYGNSFHVPFILDDHSSIAENATIQHGWRTALDTPVMGETVAGRPVVNLSLALDYWLGGLNVEVYHATNLVIHLLAGLALFGLVRRTLELPGICGDESAIRHPLSAIRYPLSAIRYP